MIGAIIGDIVGSVYEFNNHKSKEFELFQKDSTFTDDTVMTVAIADFMLEDHGSPSQARVVGYMHDWYKKYPDMSYGNKFGKWIKQFDNLHPTKFEPYNSFGNGAAMKVSPIAEMTGTIGSALSFTEWITEVSHNHPEGIKGAQATVSAIWNAKNKKTKSEIKKIIETEFGYDLSRTVDELRKTYEYNETCQRTVPEAIICFLESTDFEDAIRNAISIGGDSDTLACITGGIAEAYYQEIPEWILKETVNRLPIDIKEILGWYYESSSEYVKINAVLNKILK